MEIVNNPISFISKLLADHDSEIVQQTLQICQSVVRHLQELDDTLDKLYYAILAKKYEDAMKFATSSRQHLNKYTKDQHFINRLNLKYQNILDLIKKSLLDEFQLTSEEIVVNEQLCRAGQLLDLLSEQEQIKFLQQLCQKICSVIPNDKPFHQLYNDQIRWIFEILKDDSKYRMLDKWKFNRYIIDAWADKLRDAIFDDVENLSMKIYKLMRKIESQLQSYHPNPIDLICIAFDPFCNRQINSIISNFTIKNKFSENTMTMTISNVYEPVVNIFQQLNDIDNYCKQNMLMNERNAHILLKFYESSVNTVIKSLEIFIDSSFIANSDNLVNLKSTLHHLINSCSSMKKHFSTYASYIMNFNTDVIKQINKKIYNYYKSAIMKHLNNSVEVYRESLLSTIKKTVVNTSIKDPDVSEQIYTIGVILQKINIYDPNIKIYLLIDIDQFYKTLIDPASLADINPQLFQQVLMDIYHIKQSIKDSSGIFTEVENKVKFLNGDVLSEKIFVEQFKTFYVKHNIDTLKIIIKFKNIDKTKCANIVNNYLNV